MDLRWSPEEEEFRQEIRAYLEANAPKGLSDDEDTVEERRAWQAKLAEDRWVGIHWPGEYGGRGASLIQTVIYNEEYTKARAPTIPNALGVSLLGPTLMVYGTDTQKERFLRKVLSAEEMWCQGFSEPNSGSDLASLKTRAQEDGDEYVVNGQKIWTSYAKFGDWIFTLVRTDPSAPKHEGISFLLIDMKSPGVEVRPLREMTGSTLFAEVFFTDVRVPKENLVGAPGDGWKIAMTTLTFERGAGGLAVSVRLRRILEDFIEDSKKIRRNGWSAFEDPVARSKIGKHLVDLEVYRYTTLRSISSQAAGEPAGPEASINKVYWSEWHQRFMEDVMQIIGTPARVLSGAASEVDTRKWLREFLDSRAETIYAGTSEIQRNIISERVLGLPREARGS